MNSSRRRALPSLPLLLAGALLLCAGVADADAQPRRPDPAAAPLQSGPMVGYSTMREVLLWAQTTRPASVHFEYWVEGSPDRRWSTDTVHTSEDSAFTAKAAADRLQPGTEYRYAVHVDGERIERPYPLSFQTQELWQWRGDNTYLREADWNSRTGILYRYTHTRSLPELQPLLASTHHYATWDDHDYGPNNSDRSWWNKGTALEAFRLFWGNPAYGVDGNPGVTATFRWADIQVFLLDGPLPPGPEPADLGRANDAGRGADPVAGGRPGRQRRDVQARGPGRTVPEPLRRLRDVRRPLSGRA